MERVCRVWRRHRELARYSLVGAVTTVLTLGIYFLLVHSVLNAEAAVQLQLANLVSWFCGTLFSYCANRRFVFRSRNPHILREASSFFASRLFALVLDMALMFVLVTLLACSDELAKAASVVVQTVSNYILSKFLVFHIRKRY